MCISASSTRVCNFGQEKCSMESERRALLIVGVSFVVGLSKSKGLPTS